MIQTDIDYPEGLPPSLLARGPDQPVNPLARTSFANGRARQRARVGNLPVMAPFSLLLNSAQALTFETWYRDTLRNGTEWFNMPRKVPAGYIKLVSRFTAIYEGPLPDGPSLWRYNFQLEYYERPLLPPGWGLVPGFILDPDIFDLAMNREWPAA